MYSFLRFIPKNHLSYFVGKLMHLKLPAPLGRRVVSWFARKFDIDVESAARPIHEYPSIGAFFVRDLKEGLRPVGGEIVSPVDGVLRNYGRADEGRLEQIKGKTYSVAEFLGRDELAARFDGGMYFNFYLSPQDYHHVHCPMAGRIIRAVHIPGRLWPVNDWSMRSINDLFAINERVVTYIETERFGIVAVVMVGATNVGKMSVVYDAFVTNQKLAGGPPEIHVYDDPMQVEAGSKLGTFHMGSSVVVLFEKDRIDAERVVLPQPARLKYGEPLVQAHAISNREAGEEPK